MAIIEDAYYYAVLLQNRLLPFLIGMEKSNSCTLQRPRNPPPPAPSGIGSSRLSNGRSSESLSSMCSEHGLALGNPVPPPRKVSSYSGTINQTNGYLNISFVFLTFLKLIIILLLINAFSFSLFYFTLFFGWLALGYRKYCLSHFLSLMYLN